MFEFFWQEYCQLTSGPPALNGCCESDGVRIDFWSHNMALIAYSHPEVPVGRSSCFAAKRKFGDTFLKKQLNFWLRKKGKLKGKQESK